MLCPGHKKCFISKSSETFLVSARRATRLPRFVMYGQHHRTQCCHHNVPSSRRMPVLLGNIADAKLRPGAFKRRNNKIIQMLSPKSNPILNPKFPKVNMDVSNAY